MANQVQDAYIVAATRTPVGKARGVMRNVRPDDMLAHVMRAAVDHVPSLDPKLIDDANNDRRERIRAQVATGTLEKVNEQLEEQVRDLAKATRSGCAATTAPSRRSTGWACRRCSAGRRPPKTPGRALRRWSSSAIGSGSASLRATRTSWAASCS